MTAPPPPPPPAPSAQPSGPSANRPDTTPAVIAHAGGLLVGFLAPLLVYLLQPDDEFTRQHATAALNFQISFFIWFVVSGLLIFVLVGLVLLPVVAVTFIVLSIVASMAASRAEPYTYPLTFAFIK